eukprot:5609810-Amphidinium_carterae.2
MSHPTHIAPKTSSSWSTRALVAKRVYFSMALQFPTCPRYGVGPIEEIDIIQQADRISLPPRILILIGNRGHFHQSLLFLFLANCQSFLIIFTNMH